MVPDNKRILTATVASVAIILLWQLWFPSKAPHPTPAAKPGAPAEQAKGPAAAAPPAPAPALPAPVPAAPEELVRLAGSGFSAELSTHGAALKSLVLEGEKFQQEDKGRTSQVDVVHVTPAQPYPLSLVASPELGGPEDPLAGGAGRAAYRVASRDATSVTFEGRAGSLGVRKTYRVTGKPFELTLDLEVTGAPAAGAVVLLFPGHTPENATKGGMFSGPPMHVTEPVCRGGDKTERYEITGDPGQQKFEGPVQWVGLDVGYFIAVAMPKEPLGSCVFARGAPAKGDGLVALRVPVEGGARTMSLTVYAGPKDLDTLRSYGRGFDTAINYGAMARPFAFFARLLLYVMRWFEAIVHNWGVAIILLTVLVKLLLYPLTAKSMKSMNEMKKLQPEIEKLKAKFGSDRDKLNQATMQLYQQHKVNPLGGCLPMLLQLPIWFALYATLQTSVELYRAPFLWMHDLTQHDPFFILPVAMGASSFLMQKISPQPADNAQAKMMLYFMPIFFSVLMLFVPGGLTLYIFVNNVLSIAQQQWLMKRQERAAAKA